MARKNTSITLDLTELDVRVILEALGLKMHEQMNNRQSSKSTEILIERIYRKLGIRLDRP